MSSSACPERLDLDRDLPTTPDDVAALDRLASTPGLTLEAYLRFLGTFGALPTSRLHARQGPDGEPFDLLA
jgi:hypothetical protein